MAKHVVGRTGSRLLRMGFAAAAILLASGCHFFTAQVRCAGLRRDVPDIETTDAFASEDYSRTMICCFGATYRTAWRHGRWSHGAEYEAVSPSSARWICFTGAEAARALASTYSRREPHEPAVKPAHALMLSTSFIRRRTYGRPRWPVAEMKKLTQADGTKPLVLAEFDVTAPTGQNKGGAGWTSFRGMGCPPVACKPPDGTIWAEGVITVPIRLPGLSREQPVQVLLLVEDRRTPAGTALQVLLPVSVALDTATFPIQLFVALNNMGCPD